MKDFYPIFWRTVFHTSNGDGMKLNALILGMVLPGMSLAAGSLELSEKKIKELVENKPPSVQQIELIYDSAKAQSLQTQDEFQWQVDGSASYQSTNEDSFIPAQPITSPFYSYRLGVSKATSNGVNFSTGLFSESYSSGNLEDASTVGVEFTAQIDLHRDLLGKLSKARLEDAALEAKKQLVNSELETHGFLIESRKLFWNLIAADQKRRVASELLQSAKKQAKEAKKRFEENVADEGEVARFESQVSQRKAQVRAFEFQTREIRRAFQEIFPELNQYALEIPSFNLEKTSAEVLSCTAMIQSKPQTPVAYTQFSDVIALSKEQYKYADKIAAQYNDWDLVLEGTVQYKGKDEGYSEAVKQLDSGDTSYAVGLGLVIPLDGKKKKTEEVLREIEKKRFSAEQRNLQARIDAFHNQTTKSVDILNKVLFDQKVNSEKLELSLKVANRKFDQARITIRDLINDEDALLQSRLNEIDAQLQIVTTVLDYLAVFNKTPCAFNK